MSTPAPEASLRTAEPEPLPDRGGALPFAVVAAIFATLLGLGIALAVSIHRSYVGFERIAARHVPPDTTLVVRWDVEKVSLFEPTRRFLLPLLDERPGGVTASATPPGNAPAPSGGAPAPAAAVKSRRDRFGEQSGSLLGRDLREVVVLFGPGEHDWAVVLAGSFRTGDFVGAAARTLAIEGWAWRPAGEHRLVAPEGAALGQATDGAVVLASSAARLEAVLVERPVPPGIPRIGAGALKLRADAVGLPSGSGEVLATLGNPSTADGILRWGQPLPVEVTLRYPGRVPADVAARARQVLVGFLGPDLERLERQEAPVKVQPAGNQAVTVTVLLDDVALERVANRAAETVERALVARPARE